LIDREIADRVLPEMVNKLQESGCEVRGDIGVQGYCDGVLPASEADWETEYLDAIVSIKLVEDINEAIRHIQVHGSNHTDAIITNNGKIADDFLNRVDSAIVMVNASTQFADGAEFGMGAEIGISTGKLHARGPVGVEQLTSVKFVVRGSGQCRP
jgi:glutamate-5-semialdehyde dehydrogenase